MAWSRYKSVFFNPLNSKASDAEKIYNFFFKEVDPVGLLGLCMSCFAVPFTICAAIHVHIRKPQNSKNDKKKELTGPETPIKEPYGAR